MGKLTLILGGARSGKSEHAETLALNSNSKVAYIATCMWKDGEMEERIKNHQKRRPSSWKTVEEPKNIASIVPAIDKNFDTVIIDCLTIYTSNLIFEKLSRDEILQNITSMTDALKSASFNTIIVSNEVGMGIVPEQELGRKFRDIAGNVNKLVASVADEVLFIIAGIPMKLK